MADRHMQIRGGQIKDGSISEIKLDISNAPVDGYLLQYNQSEGKFEWVPGNDAVTEIPSGSINGVNQSYTITNTPQVGTVHLYLNGLYQEEGSGNDYLLSGTDITFVQAPETDDVLIISYLKSAALAGLEHVQGTDTTLGPQAEDLDMNNNSIINLNPSSIQFQGGGSITKSDYEAAVAHKDLTTNPHTIDKNDVGLANVPNVDTTSAVNDSHAHSNSAELDLVTDGNHDVRSDNPHAVDKTDVGLSNVTNDAQIPASQKGSASGVAELDGTGKVPSGQLPSYVDDVVEYANQAAFPGTGNSGIIYVALDTNKVYRWSGSAYTEISESLALGETSSTAYRGDRGKTGYDHSQESSGNPHTVTKSEVGLSNVPNVDTTDAVNNEHDHSNSAQLDLVSDGDHDVRSDNPHGVDKTDISLGNVPNLDTTDAVNNEHEHSNKVQVDLITDGDHDVRTDNPHSITKAQVGLTNVADVNTTVSNLQYVLDGGDQAITTGIKGQIEIPFDCTITGVTLVGDQSGSIVVDINKSTYAGFPTTASIVNAGAKPTLSSSQKYQDNTLTSWTVSLSAGDIIEYEVDSVSTVQRVLVSLMVERT